MVNRRTIYMFESGLRKLTPRTRANLADALSKAGVIFLDIGGVCGPALGGK